MVEHLKLCDNSIPELCDNIIIPPLRLTTLVCELLPMDALIVVLHSPAMCLSLRRLVIDRLKNGQLWDEENVCQLVRHLQGGRAGLCVALPHCPMTDFHIGFLLSMVPKLSFDIS